MENQKRTISFVYDVHDHSLKFPLKAAVERTGTDIYTITDIRLDNQENGSLLPPIQLVKKDGHWVFLDNNKESNLSTTIGQAIDQQLLSLGQ